MPKLEKSFTIAENDSSLEKVVKLVTNSYLHSVVYNAHEMGADFEEKFSEIVEGMTPQKVKISNADNDVLYPDGFFELEYPSFNLEQPSVLINKENVATDLTKIISGNCLHIDKKLLKKSANELVYTCGSSDVDIYLMQIKPEYNEHFEKIFNALNYQQHNDFGIYFGEVEELNQKVIDGEALFRFYEPSTGALIKSGNDFFCVGANED